MADIVTQILSWLLWLFGIVIVGVIVFIIYMNTKYKHKVKIRKIIKGRTVILEDKARDIKDQWKVSWWKLQKLKSKIPLPPSDCIDLTNKGKLTCEFYLTEDGAYIPIKDDFSLDRLKELSSAAMLKKNRVDEAVSIHKEILALKPGDRTDAQKQFLEDFPSKLEEFTQDEIDAVEFMKEFKPLTTQERALMTQEHSKALEYKQKKSWQELAQTAILFGAPIILIALLLIFVPDILASFGELLDKLASVADSLNDAVDRLADVEQGVVNLDTEPSNVPN